MKRLGLLRHAKSDWGDMTKRDFDRGLNDRGRKGAALMGAHIRESGATWDHILASAAERVKRTLDAAGLGVDISFRERAYLADSQQLMALLREMPDAHDAVLVAGHNPGMQELALDLVECETDDPLYNKIMQKYPTAAYAVLELDIASWADIAPQCGQLKHFARPRDLDPELGPESGSQ